MVGVRVVTEWSLPVLLEQFHKDIEHKLATARRSLAHTVTKGDASERVWLEMLRDYLPRRYTATKAHVVDSNGTFSEQIDVVVFDRQYSPFIFNFQGQEIVPAESVYAVFEAKQTISAALIQYAMSKAATVRRLRRTSLPIPTASGGVPAKKPGHILAGILTFESEWSPPLGSALVKALKQGGEAERLDMGCVAAHGTFTWDAAGFHAIIPKGKPATAFLLELIARLQELATVPMIDVRAYAKWLSDNGQDDE
jgi:Domain of unknown function (DUF6602)